MRCPTLAELPPPPLGKTGWPWTVESPQMPDVRPDGTPWPRISIITPSYNQGQYVEETIRSVLLQGYPNLEYYILDGGSVDDSASIINKYSQWLAYWVSAKDGGQVKALNSGIAMCTGEIINWLNSDDFLYPGALSKLAKAIELCPDAEIITACRTQCDKNGDVISIEFPSIYYWPLYMLGLAYFPQDATFLSRQALMSVMPLDDRLDYGFDTALYHKLIRHKRKIVIVDALLSTIRVYPEMKTLRFDPKKKTEEMLYQLEYRNRGLASRIVDRLMHTRLHAIVYGIVRTVFSSSSYISVLKYDPIASEWVLAPMG